MKTFSEICFETLHRTKPFDWPDQLEKSPVTDADIQEVEHTWGIHFPEEFKEFLKSYILPDPTVVYGKFTGDWAGGGITWSHELKRYLTWEEIPEDQEVLLLKFVLDGLEGMADLREHSLRENMERLSWTGTALLGYLLLGEFTDHYLFLECETGAVVYVDHDFYSMSHQKEIDNIREYKSMLFENFHDLLQCLFLGAVYDGVTGEVENAEGETRCIP